MQIEDPDFMRFESLQGDVERGCQFLGRMVTRSHREVFCIDSCRMPEIHQTQYLQLHDISHRYMGSNGQSQYLFRCSIAIEAGCVDANLAMSNENIDELLYDCCIVHTSSASNCTKASCTL